MNTTSSVTPAQTPTVNVGDSVAHSTQFLEGIGESHAEMAEGRGIVRNREAVNDDFVLVFVDRQGRSPP